MGSTSPRPPALDVPAWRALPWNQRLEAVATDWTQRGAGAPQRAWLISLLKVAIWAGGAALIVSFTRGLGGPGSIASWWAEPVVYQKVVIWTLLWELLGLGTGSSTLTFDLRFAAGAAAHRLRPGTVRLPPLPGRVPGTAGTTRTGVDVALLAAVLGVGIALIAVTGSADGTLPVAGVGAFVLLLVLLGLRDLAAFLAARPEQLGVMLIVFLFPPTDLVFALKLVMVGIWWGAAAAELTRHWPYALAVRLGTAPWTSRPRRARLLWSRRSGDLRPSRLARRVAYTVTAVQFAVPLVLLVADGGVLTTAAVTVMVLFHLLAVAAAPVGSSPAMNAFAAYSTVVLFGHLAGVGIGTLDSPLVLVVLVLLLVVLPTLADVRPDLVALVPAARHHSGNSATSLWLLRTDAAADLLHETFATPATLVAPAVLDADATAVQQQRATAFRALHVHGRALTGLLGRAVEDPDGYTVLDGDLVAATVLGAACADGRVQGERLLGVVQQRCGFAAGELRVITLSSQPLHRGEQRYRILDAADGLVEKGEIDVDDMVARRPWPTAADDTIPVEVLVSSTGFAGYTTPAEFAFLSEAETLTPVVSVDPGQDPRVRVLAPFPLSPRPTPWGRGPRPVAAGTPSAPTTDSATSTPTGAAAGTQPPDDPDGGRPRPAPRPRANA